MKIALLGYGKMGKEIETLASERGHQTVLKIDVSNLDELTHENLRKADVAIDFTTPDSAVRNMLFCFDAGVPVVCGTTGWNRDISMVSSACLSKGQSLFYASNFSIGVNVLFAVNEYLAGIMNRYGQYGVSIEEVHHTQKLDAPSGTAISIAEQIISKLDRKNSWSLENKENDPGSIHITAVREGDIKGTHTVLYESEVDLISLRHHSKSRKGLALGAVMAAEFLKDRKGVFTMRDLLGI